MWKLFAFTLAALGLLTGLAPPLPSPVHLQEWSSHPPHVLRFRVIANSDSPWDQAVKIATRNAVLRVLDPRLASDHNTGEAVVTVRALVPLITRRTNQLLAREGAPYRARVSLGSTLFPTKAYGTWVLPAGAYEALIIKLGRARGHNWWCVLFPSLCFVDMGSGLAIPSQPLDVSPNQIDSGGGRSGLKQPLRVEWWIPSFLRQVLRGL